MEYITELNGIIFPLRIKTLLITITSIYISFIPVAVNIITTSFWTIFIILDTTTSTTTSTSISIPTC
nr:MAG TPA: hypothetical protein [Caudoviricetes sp.]